MDEDRVTERLHAFRDTVKRLRAGYAEVDAPLKIENVASVITKAEMPVRATRAPLRIPQRIPIAERPRPPAWAADPRPSSCPRTRSRRGRRCRRPTDSSGDADDNHPRKRDQRVGRYGEEKDLDVERGRERRPQHSDGAASDHDNEQRASQVRPKPAGDRAHQPTAL
jgi:hypothetical protein